MKRTYFRYFQNIKRSWQFVPIGEYNVIVYLIFREVKLKIFL